MEIDLGAKKLIAAEKLNEKIAVEINPHDRGGPAITPRHENGFSR